MRTEWRSRFTAKNDCKLYAFVQITNHVHRLTCLRYIELNPVRAWIVGDPGIIVGPATDHTSAKASWIGWPSRRRIAVWLPVPRSALAYRELFIQPLATYDLEAIRIHLSNDRALGSSNFQDDIEAMVG